MGEASHLNDDVQSAYDGDEGTEQPNIIRDWAEEPYDVTLVVKHGEHFKAHGNILRGTCCFFEKILDGNWKENQDGVIRLEGLSEEIMEAMLRFIYTGTLHVNDVERAMDLIETADYLLFPKLKDIPEHFLEQNLSFSNCVLLNQFAGKYRCEKLLATSRKFIQSNFTSVANTEDFCELSVDEVEEWISSDVINISAEDDVFRIILRWIDYEQEDRKEKFPSLFRHVRLGFVSLSCLLNEVVTNDYVKKDELSLNNILEWTNGSPVCCELFRQSPRKSLQEDALVALGGEKTAWCYVPSKNEWFQLPDIPSSVDNPEWLLSFQNSLIAVGFNSTWLEEFPYYDPFVNEWTTSFLPTPQALLEQGIEPEIATVMVVGEDICAIVEDILSIDDDEGQYSYQRTLFKYSPGSEWWTMVPSFHLEPNLKAKYEVCFVAADKCIYAIGGTKVLTDDDEEEEDEYSLQDAARFHITEDKWEKIACIQRARSSAFGIAVDQKIFVAGGYFLDSGIFASRLERIPSRTCEMYDILTNQWQFIANLTIPRANASMVCVSGTLYVLGGLVKSQNATIVECYNREKNEWTQVTAAPAEVSPCICKEPSITSACSMSIFLNGDLHSVLPNVDVLMVSEVEELEASMSDDSRSISSASSSM